MKESKDEIRSSLTLTQFILAGQAEHPEASGQLSVLLHAIEIASKFTASKVKQAGMFNLYGVQGGTNASGDSVKKLDVIANEAFITALTRSRTVGLMVSEENPELLRVGDCSGKYCVTFDPLDGSSNIDANVSIGTIFGIFKAECGEGEQGSEASVLRPGKDLVAAGYTMYGSATMLVFTTGPKDGVNGFTLDPTLGEFVLTHPNIRIPETRPIYSVNEGNSKFWEPHVREYVESLKYPKDDGKPYSHRYVGSMVADVHRTLLYGGIFMYPADSKSKQGKLRQLYECGPMAFIVVNAGGKAVDGTRTNMLDIVPSSLHETSGIVLGSAGEVDKYLSFLPEQSSCFDLFLALATPHE